MSRGGIFPQKLLEPPNRFLRAVKSQVSMDYNSIHSMLRVIYT